MQKIFKHKSVNKNITKNKGFVLLYAVLVTTVIVGIGVLVSGIITRQIIVSAIAQESHQSYYMADASYYCLDFLNFHFFYSIDNENYSKCFESDYDFLNINVDEIISVDIDNKICSNIELLSSNVFPLESAEIYGYNQGNSSDCPSGSSRNLVERYVHYGQE
ncbi:MAG: hypothetical protein ACOCU8_01995 [Patescibacteria group bacterium]